METREPKRGQGVPKETRERNSIVAIQDCLRGPFPTVAWQGLADELEDRGFFAAGMQAQIRIMAETILQMIPDSVAGQRVIEALAASPVENRISPCTRRPVAMTTVNGYPA